LRYDWSGIFLEIRKSKKGLSAFSRHDAEPTPDYWVLISQKTIGLATFLYLFLQLLDFERRQASYWIIWFHIVKKPRRNHPAWPDHYAY